MPRTKKNNINTKPIETEMVKPIETEMVKPIETEMVKSVEDTNKINEPKKRGRKPKKDLEANKAITKDISLDNIVCKIIETNIADIEEDTVFENILDNSENNNCETLDSEQSLSNKEETQKPASRKRGRKPKGGKIIQQIIPLSNVKETKPNVILHLKCSLKDLNTTNNLLNSNIEGYNFSSNNESCYEIISHNENTLIQNILNQNTNIVSNFTHDNLQNNSNINNCNKYLEDENYSYSYNDEDDTVNKESKDIDSKEIWKKLKYLEHNLHINNISDKKSACFWCTYEFDNPPIYIPKYYIKDSYHVYGCFCSPECATAYLMEENIDSSSKFERYHLINHLYSKIYDYKKNIKPAPNPYYMLDKFYGNLSIQEYRALLRNERLFLVVDKPLTRILPELHEDNDDFIINNKIIPSNTYQIKKKLQKKPQTKNNILNEKFGLS